MFKRVAKKQQKRREDEELGLDEDVEQMFGLQDTDSDESSSSDSDSDSDGDLDGGSAPDIKTEWLAGDDVDSDGEDDGEEEDLDLENYDDEPPISLEEAVKNPIYHISSENDVRTCIACLRKLLKNDKMVEVHIASAAHIRRFKKFCELAENTGDRKIDPRRIASSISQMPTSVVNAEGLSNRALKRKQKLDTIKRKRENTKQIIERKKRKGAKKDAHGEKGEGKSGESGKAATSQFDKPASERPAKRRRVSIKEATHENDGGLDGDNAKSVDHAAMNVGKEKEVLRSSKMGAGTKSKSRGEDRASASSVKSETSKPKEKGKAKGSKEGPNVKIFFDDGSTIKPNGAHSMKTRDLLKLRTKGHFGRAGAGKFAKLSDTRVVKDKSRPTLRLGSESKTSTARTPKRATRYFDDPEDGAQSKQAGPKDSSAKARSERKSHGPDKGGGENQKQKQNKRKEKVANDLVIFE